MPREGTRQAVLRGGEDHVGLDVQADLPLRAVGGERGEDDVGLEGGVEQVGELARRHAAALVRHGGEVAPGTTAIATPQ